MASKLPEQVPATSKPKIIGVPGRTQMVVEPVLGGGKAIPSPPGTKVPRQPLPWMEDPPSPWPGRLLAAGIAAAALVLGILIDRFLLH
jgi:hypothetical protein